VPAAICWTLPAACTPTRLRELMGPGARFEIVEAALMGPKGELLRAPDVADRARLDPLLLDA
jgi:hypothetical protein